MSQLLTLGAAFVGAMWGTIYSLHRVTRKLDWLLDSYDSYDPAEADDE